MNPRARSNSPPTSTQPGAIWPLLGVALGAAVAWRALPRVAPSIALSLASAEPRTWWYLSRASGLVAFALLSLSVLLGLLLSTRLAKGWPGAATAFDLHEHASLLSLAFGALHALVLLADPHAGLSLPGLVVPFAASKHALGVGLGQVALDGLALVVASFYVRKHIGQKAWRALHALTFGVFVLGIVHGVMMLTDRGAMIAALVPAVAACLLTAYRVVTLVGPAGAGRARSGVSAA